MGNKRRPVAPKRKHFPPAPWRFREARLSCGLGVGACADLLKVSERTVRNWEAGAVRIPYAAYKLMRVLRGGKVLGPEWRDFRVWRNVLVTPEGHRFEAGDLAWWSLLVRQAHEFRALMATRRAAAPDGPAALAAVASGVAVPSFSAERSVLFVPGVPEGLRAGEAGPGLVSLLDKSGKGVADFYKNPVFKGYLWSCNWLYVGPSWGHVGAIPVPMDATRACCAEEDQLETARRSSCDGRRSSGSDGYIGQRLHRYGHPQLHPLPGKDPSAAGCPVSWDASYRHVERQLQSFSAIAVHVGSDVGSESGGESTLPLWLGSEVQALPRSLTVDVDGGAL